MTHTKKEDIYTITPFASGGFAVHIINDGTYKKNVKGKILGVFETLDEATEWVEKNKVLVSLREGMKNGNIIRTKEELPF